MVVVRRRSLRVVTISSPRPTGLLADGDPFGFDLAGRRPARPGPAGELVDGVVISAMTTTDRSSRGPSSQAWWTASEDPSGRRRPPGHVDVLSR